MSIARSNPPRRLSEKRERELRASGRSVYSTATRGAKPKPVNRARQKREKVRIYGSAAHKAWLHAQTCVITNQYGTEYNPIVAAHTKGDGGGSYKASARYQVPMLHSLHQELHAGVQTFEAKYGVSLVELAAKSYARFLTDMTEAEYALGEITEADVTEDVA